MQKGNTLPKGEMPNLQVIQMRSGWQIRWNFQEVTRSDMDEDAETTSWDYDYVNVEKLSDAPRDILHDVYTAAGYTQYQIDIAFWKHPEFSKRIVAPIGLILDDIGIKMYGWFNINGMPVVRHDESTVHLYCNHILEEHQDIIDQLQGVITIEDIPNADDYAEDTE